MKLLLAEDDAILADALGASLTKAGFEVEVAPNGAVAEFLLLKQHFDIGVLDLGLPMVDGLTVLKRVRAAKPALPMLVLTALDGLEHRVAGLNAGADDYLTKPFDFAELGARVRALLRRPEHARAPQLRVGDVELDPAAHTVRRAGVTVPLTAREFALLHFLMDRAGDVVTRSELLEAVWDAHYDGLSNVVDVHVANVRRKLELPGRPAPIDTVRGVGYRIG